MVEFSAVIVVEIGVEVGQRVVDDRAEFALVQRFYNLRDAFLYRA